MSASYEAAFAESIADREAFWLRAAEAIDWAVPPTRAYTQDAGWFAGARLNTCYNCIDRHLPKRANQTAIIWEGDDPTKSKHITYAELADRVGQAGRARAARRELDLLEVVHRPAIARVDVILGDLGQGTEIEHLALAGLVLRLQELGDLLARDVALQRRIVA